MLDTLLALMCPPPPHAKQKDHFHNTRE